MAAGGGLELGTDVFLARVQGLSKPELAAAGLDPVWRRRYGLVQASFGTPALHYEVWLQRPRRQVEVGLHLEAEPALNGWLLERLGGSWPRLGHALGEGFELEQWTASWGRVHALETFQRVDEELVARVSRRLVDCVRALQPELETLLAERRP
jgi:hypothetical protein